MSKIQINTSQNVTIEFQLASVGERLLAFIIDMLIKFAYIVFIFFVFIKILKIDKRLSYLDDWSLVAVYIIISLPAHIYTIVLEHLMEGQTFGKKIMKIKVIKIDGYQPYFTDHLTRWFFRLIDVFSNSGVIGLLSIIFSKNNQRLGDIATETAVISVKEKYNISHTILENVSENYQPNFPQVIQLTDNDLRIIKDYFSKAKMLQDNLMMAELANKVKSTLKIPNSATEKMSNQTFLTTIIKDYTFYTGQQE